MRHCLIWIPESFMRLDYRKFIRKLAILVLIATTVGFCARAQSLPSSWSDQDIGQVGLTGSATYSDAAFTISGAGQGLYAGSADGVHFAYLPLSGDGVIVARLASVQGSSAEAGLMIRETLDPGATSVSHVFAPSWGHFMMFERSSTGAGSSYQYDANQSSLPYWKKLVGAGRPFSGYHSSDGVNWLQSGTNQTVSMAQNAYVGLVVSSTSNTTLATATFDYVSVSSTASPGPSITRVSATTAAIGSQVVITGSGFGATQGASAVTLSGSPMTIDSWSDTSIVITISASATSGYLVVSVAPRMNNSNVVDFEIPAQPLPVSWLGQDIGVDGMAGSATYANGVFTISGAGQGLYAGSADGVHFAYLPLSGDGVIVARLASVQGSSAEAGLMIRETLDPGATSVTHVLAPSWGHFMMFERSSTGAGSSYQYGANQSSLPYWIKLVRSGSTFSGYTSSDGVNWLQSGPNQTVSMAQNAYVGLVVSSTRNTTLATATFDYVSVSSTASPGPSITRVSATTAAIGSQVVITGSGFGATQGASAVTLSGSPMLVNSWSDTSIVITISTSATSGYLVVSVAPSMNNSNVVDFSITTQPLPRSEER